MTTITRRVASAWLLGLSLVACLEAPPRRHARPRVEVARVPQGTPLRAIAAGAPEKPPPSHLGRAAPDAPARRLAPTWEIAGDGERALIVGSGWHAIARGDFPTGTASVRANADGRELAALATAPRDYPEESVVALGELMFFLGPSGPSLFDPLRRSLMWERPEVCGLERPRYLARADATIFATDGRGVGAIDAATGSCLWQTDLRGDHFRRGIGVGPTSVAVRQGDLVEAFDRRDGWPLWRRELGRSFALAPFGDGWLTGVEGSGLWLLSRNGGAKARFRDRSIGWPRIDDSDPVFGEVLVAGDRVWLSNEGQLASFTSAGGESWRREGLGRIQLGGIERGGGALFGCDLGGNVVALDPVGGRELWRYGAGCRGFGSDGETLIALTPSGAMGFAPGADEVPLEDVTITGVVVLEGTPRGPVDVVVSGIEARTDDAGRFEVSLRARGWVFVRADEHQAAGLLGRPDAGVSSEELRLDGRQRYQVRLTGHGREEEL
jgi:hypothetical protein